MKRILPLVAVAALLGLSASGCGEDAASLPPGSMSVSWLVGTGGCEPARVETIAIFVSGGGSPGSDLYTFDCEDGGGTIPGLQPGNYDLNLRGRDANGVDRFSGFANNVQVRSSGTTTVGTVRLTALPATITVTWYFENGRWCTFNDVQDVVVTLFEDEYEIYSVTEACNAEVVEFAEIQADTYIVDAIGLDVDGRAVFNGQEEVTVDRGDEKDVEIRLSEVSSGRVSTR